MAQGVPPNPGGYLEWGGLSGMLGAPEHWHSYNGTDLYGPMAVDKFNQYASSPMAGGSEDPYSP